ncbi:MAG: MFS transporter [Chloroflexota bacterium]
MAIAPCEREAFSNKAFAFNCTPDSRPWVLAATILASSAAFINASVVTVALPAIQRDLGASVADVQWVINGYTLLLGALILVGGAAGDVFGRRRVFLIGLIIGGTASVGCALAPNIAVLVAGRLVQGIGGALVVPTSLAILSAAYPEGQRGKAIGTWSGATAVATALGPLAGGWLVDTASWRPVMLLEAPLLLAALAITTRRVPETHDRARGKGIDWLGAALATVSLGAITWGFVSSPSLGWTSPAVAGSLALGVVGLSLFLYVEGRVRSPMMPLGLFSSPTFSGVNLLTAFLYFSLYGLFFFLPFNLIQVQGYSAAVAGATFIPFDVLLAVLSPWAGGLRDRYGARLPLVVGPLIAAAAFALFAVPGVGGSYWLTFFPAITLLGLGMAVTVAPLTTTVMSSVDERNIGAASGINTAVSRVAGLLAVAVLGAVMVNVFSGSLAADLARANLPPQLVQATLSQSQSLANLAVPQTASAEQARAIEAAVDAAFVAGYRVVMWVCAGLALLSAVSAAIVADNRQRTAKA